MRIRTLSDRNLMRHWDCWARIAFSPVDEEVAKKYIRRMVVIEKEMDRRDAERRQQTRQPQKGNDPQSGRHQTPTR